MKKGLGVIVAQEDKNGILKTDTIINCDAHMLSITAPRVLQETDFSKINENHILYICGHGNRKKRTISGLSMKKIAQLLVEHKYSGKQQIVIASCSAARRKHGKTFADELHDELLNLDVESECTAFSNGFSVFTENDNNECDAFTITIRSQLYHAILLALQSYAFPEIGICEIKKNLKQYKSSVNSWNKDLVNGKIPPTVMCVQSLIITVFSFVIAIILNTPYFNELYNFGFTPDSKVLVTAMLLSIFLYTRLPKLSLFVLLISSAYIMHFGGIVVIIIAIASAFIASMYRLFIFVKNYLI